MLKQHKLVHISDYFLIIVESRKTVYCYLENVCVNFWNLMKGYINLHFIED